MHLRLQFCFVIIFCISTTCYSQYRESFNHQKEKTFISIHLGDNFANNSTSFGVELNFDIIRSKKIETSIGLNYNLSFDRYRSYLNNVPRQPNEDFRTLHRFQNNRISQMILMPINFKFFYSRKLKFYSSVGYSFGYFLRENENLFYSHSIRTYGFFDSERIIEDDSPNYVKEYDISCKRGLIQDSNSTRERLLHQIYMCPIGIRLKKSRIEMYLITLIVRQYQQNYFGIKYSRYLI